MSIAYTAVDRELEVIKMRQDVSGSFHELQRAATLVLEMIFELKADVSRLYSLEDELAEDRAL